MKRACWRERRRAAVGPVPARHDLGTRGVAAERGVTLGVALILDRLAGEPPRALHPVVWLGMLATLIERRAPSTTPTAQLAYGTALVGVVVGSASVLATLAEVVLGRLPLGP